MNDVVDDEEFIGGGFPFEELPTELFQKIIELVPESLHDLRLVIFNTIFLVQLLILFF